MRMMMMMEDGGWRLKKEDGIEGGWRMGDIRKSGGHDSYSHRTVRSIEFSLGCGVWDVGCCTEYGAKYLLKTR